MGGGLEDDVSKVGQEKLPALPPVTAGTFTPEVQERVESFFHSVAAIFEAWVNRRRSGHTRRAYRGDVMAFVEFRGWTWPGDAPQLLRTSILDVQAFKDAIAKHGGAPKTINRRISSLSAFYRFLSGAEDELRLPITVPNPAHAQFIAREASDPVEETRAMSETRARQLMAMVTGESLIELRDRAILKFYLYTGARIETGCALNVGDFHQDGDEATVRFHLNLSRLPGAMQEKEVIARDGKPIGETVQVCVYSPHAIRATTATLLLDARESIESVQKLLDHKHITTTQIYDKRRRSVRDSASHKVPI